MKHLEFAQSKLTSPRLHERTHTGQLNKMWAASGYRGLSVTSTPWCGGFVNWCLANGGYGHIVKAIPKGMRLRARVWDIQRHELAKLGVERIGGPEAIENEEAKPGDIVTYTRNGTTRRLDANVSGHVNFFVGYASGGKFESIGGNQSNAVTQTKRSVARVLSVYRLPAPNAVKTPSADKLTPLMPHLKRHEGGFVNHPKDPGGATNMGITLATFRRHIKRNGTVSDLKRMTWEQAAKVYRSQYWNKVRGDDLPPGVDYTVFDFAVNSGPSRAAKFLQRIVGVEQDGEIGPITLAAVNRMAPADVINGVCDARLSFMQGLKTWPTFRKGWSRRVKDVKAHSLKLASQTVPAQPTPKPSKPPKGQDMGFTGILTAVSAFARVFGNVFTPLGKGENKTARNTSWGAFFASLLDSSTGVLNINFEPILSLLSGFFGGAEPSVGPLFSGGAFQNGLIAIALPLLNMVFEHSRKAMREETDADDDEVEGDKVDR